MVMLCARHSRGQFPHYAFISFPFFSPPRIARGFPPLHFPHKLKRRNIQAAAAMDAKTTAPFGSWKSPLTAELVSGATLRLGGIAVHKDGSLFWVEGRPLEGGRMVLVSQTIDGSSQQDITPLGFNVRTTVHEYGGGSFCLDEDQIIFSNYADQRLYMQSTNGGTPVPLTPAYNGSLMRYADGNVDKRFKRYITIREDHHHEGQEAVNEIVAVQLTGDPNNEPRVLVKGNDFYAFPRISPDGQKLAWIEWRHPNMPWDEAALFVGHFSEDGQITSKVCIAGNDENIREAPSEPRWSPEGELFFVSDRGNGFWNIYQWVERTGELKPVYSLNAEFTTPAWNFGNCSYAFLPNVSLGTRIVCTYRQRGVSHLGVLHVPSNSLSMIETPFTSMTDLHASRRSIFMVAGSPKHPLSIFKVDTECHKDGTYDYALRWSSASFDILQYERTISIPTIIEFPTKIPGKTAFANFYPPTNAMFQGPEGERPPLLVRSHGGPTSEVHTLLQLSVQYWTSRGWAFADVNYGGSTGYGREYRERLYGTWGIVDVDDCCSCAAYLVSAGLVDGRKLCIDGRSAGGYTTLAALVFRETFKAGASWYGVSDLSALMKETHKFESHYLKTLIGSDPEALFNRSPINFPEKLTSPIILFQGLEDKVVPPNQARLIYEAVKSRGVYVALVEYEGEQHGFRKAENIKHTLEQEILFFSRTLLGIVADNIKPVHIDNLD